MDPVAVTVIILASIVIAWLLNRLHKARVAYKELWVSQLFWAAARKEWQEIHGPGEDFPNYWDWRAQELRNRGWTGKL